MIYTITLNPAIDRLLFIAGKLTKRKTNRITEVQYDIGGKGLHGSYALSKLGISNKALGFYGESNKNFFLEILEEKKISHDLIPVNNENTRECYVVLEEEVGGSTMFTEQGFHIQQTEKQLLLDKLREIITEKDVVLLAGSLPQNYQMKDLEEIILLLKKIGCFIACDLSGEALKKAVELKVDFIKPNEFELHELLNNKANEDIKGQLTELSQKVPCIVASKGSMGSYCIYEKNIYEVSAPNVEEVNDTGAGDCFVGAFLGELSLKKSIEECLRYASACAASKVQHINSTTFDLKEVQELISLVEVKKIN